MNDEWSVQTLPTARHTDLEEPIVSDSATGPWQAALEVLAATPELGRGKLSIIRMTRVLDVDGTLVLVVGSAFAKDIVEVQAREDIARALATVVGHEVPFEVTVDTSLELSSPSTPAAAPSEVPSETTATPPPAATAQPFSRPGTGGIPGSPAVPPVPRSHNELTEDAVAQLRSFLAGRDAEQAAATSSPSAYPEAAESSTRSWTTSTSPVPQAGTAAVAPGVPGAVGTGSPMDPTDDSQLNPRYTFDTYVTGASNRFAHATAVAVAEAPAKAYNPLFIYGGSGLGKTHLLHAIGHYARSLYPGIRVKYVNSEEFVSDFIASVADGRMESFKRRYREVDILLVDDIQFLQGKEQTLEEFFHTFNALHNANKQVVITSDQPPKALGGFEERLRSRFEWGLLTDVQPPDLETRIAILSRKARAEGIDVPVEVLEYLASRVSTNIRELEGALIRVTAFASLNKQPVDHILAEMVLKDLITNPENEEITTSLIMAQTADYFGITIDDLCSANRSRTIVNARHVAMYLCRELTDLSLPKIGREFGGRDHTTVMSADKKIRTQMAERRSTFTQVTELTSRIKQAGQTPR